MMLKAYFWARRLMLRQEGQGMTEYGLIIALIAVVLIAVLTSMSGQLETTFNKITGALTDSNK